MNKNFMNKNNFFYFMFSFCFPFLLAENDSDTNGVISNTPKLSVTTEVSDKNFIITIRPYEAGDGNQVTVLKEILENATKKKYIHPDVKRVFCGVANVNLLKELYIFDSKKAFPIDDHKGHGDISDRKVVMRFPLISALQVISALREEKTTLREEKTTTLPKVEKCCGSDGCEVDKKYETIIPNDPLDNSD